METNKITFSELFSFKGLYSKKQWLIINLTTHLSILFIGFLFFYMAETDFLNVNITVSALSILAIGLFVINILSTIKRLRKTIASVYLVFLYLVPYGGFFIIAALCLLVPDKDSI